MNLPHSFTLPIDKLAAVFKSKSATYKFYWFLALIELVEEGHVELSKRKIFSRMISTSWYTINYFHISFGKQDNLQIAVERILKEEKLTIDEKRSKLETCLENSTKKETINQLFHFDTYVPYRFLTPWFPKNEAESDNEQMKRIISDSKFFANETLYALHKDFISINPIWISYIKSNAKILKDFSYWNLYFKHE